jgi:hypothetical protein
MTQAVSILINHLVALFNASDDTVEMVSTHARRSGFNCVVGCHFSDLKKGDAEPVKTLRHRRHGNQSGAGDDEGVLTGSYML